MSEKWLAFTASNWHEVKNHYAIIVLGPRIKGNACREKERGCRPWEVREWGPEKTVSSDSEKRKLIIQRQEMTSTGWYVDQNPRDSLSLSLSLSLSRSRYESVSPYTHVPVPPILFSRNSIQSGGYWGGGESFTSSFDCSSLLQSCLR
jgi:hypothetical protein